MKSLQTAFAVMVAAAITSSVTAGFIPLSTSASLDTSTNDVTFTIEFSQTPDYITRDSGNHTANGWQIDILDDANKSMFVIAQGSMTLPDDQVYMRTYGNIQLGHVAYSVTGSTETFTLPYTTISGGIPFSGFHYTLYTTIFGAAHDPTLSFSVPTPIVTPEPSSAIMLGMASIVAAGFGVKRRWPAMTPRPPVPSRRR